MERNILLLLIPEKKTNKQTKKFHWIFSSITYIINNHGSKSFEYFEDQFIEMAIKICPVRRNWMWKKKLFFLWTIDTVVPVNNSADYIYFSFLNNRFQWFDLMGLYRVTHTNINQPRMVYTAIGGTHLLLTDTAEADTQI